MNKYQLSNSALNYQKLIAIFGITFVHVIILVIVDFSIYLKLLSIVINILLIILVTFFFRRNAFLLSFTDDGIIQHFKFTSANIRFDYKDLISVKYNDFSKAPSENVFTWTKENKNYTLKTEALIGVENFVGFIKWLKTKNPSFETYVYPKGSVLHMRLRQEILGKEY